MCPSYGDLNIPLILACRFSLNSSASTRHSFGVVPIGVNKPTSQGVPSLWSEARCLPPHPALRLTGPLQDTAAARAARRNEAKSEAGGDPRTYSQPRLQDFPGGRNHLETQENKGEPGGRSRGAGINFWPLMKSRPRNMRNKFKQSSSLSFCFNVEIRVRNIFASSQPFNYYDLYACNMRMAASADFRVAANRSKSARRARQAARRGPAAQRLHGGRSRILYYSILYDYIIFYDIALQL